MNNLNIRTLYVEAGPILFEGPAFEKVWAEQTNLMEAYREAGRLSQWPVSIQPKENQGFYREFLGFLEEEIIEATSEAEDVFVLARENKVPEAIDKLVSLNEEIADSLHFWVELFIFLNYEIEDFKEYYKNLHDAYYFNSAEGDILKLAFQFAEGWARVNLQKLPSELSFGVKAMPETFEQAGSIIGPQIIERYEKYTFKCIQALQLAKNCLKSKYWKAREYEVNHTKFNELIMEAWLNWILSLHILNLRPAQLVQNYLLKNAINHRKIKTH